MLVVRTTEDPADPIRELVSTKQPLGLRDLAFGVDPLGLYGVEPRALDGQRARYYPNTPAAGFDLAVVGVDPAPHPTAFVPGSVVPDQKQGLLAHSLEPSATPSEEPGGYVADRPTIYEPKPSLLKPRQIQPVAGEGLRLGIVLPGLYLPEAHRLARLTPGAQVRPLKARKPRLILEAQSPLRMALGQPDQPISIPFFRAYAGSGLSIQRLARSQRTPSLASVARMVSALTRLSVIPSSKLTSAAIARVQKVPSLPNSLGRWWRSCRRDSAPPSSKAAWTSSGREEPAFRAPRPRSSKSWMALRTVCEPHSRFSAIRGARSPRALAKRIWQRLRTKASLERNPASRASRSFFESVRYEDWRFHGHYCNSSLTTCSEDALGHHLTAHSPYLQGRYHVPHLHSHEEIETLTSELESALSAARRAGEVLCAGFGAEHDITYKGEVDFVTEIDEEAERVIREELLGTFPTHGMLAEEGGELAGNEDARWIVDPLDGTTNYAHGLRNFCVSVALERAGEVVLGVVHDPMGEETFVAQRGRGATR